MHLWFDLDHAGKRCLYCRAQEGNRSLDGRPDPAIQHTSIPLMVFKVLRQFTHIRDEIATKDDSAVLVFISCGYGSLSLKAAGDEYRPWCPDLFLW